MGILIFILGFVIGSYFLDKVFIYGDFTLLKIIGLFIGFIMIIIGIFSMLKPMCEVAGIL